jgi:hypothetical protein
MTTDAATAKKMTTTGYQIRSTQGKNILTAENSR